MHISLREVAGRPFPARAEGPRATTRRAASGDSEEAQLLSGEDEEEGDEEEGRQPRIVAHRAFVAVTHLCTCGCLRHALCASIASAVSLSLKLARRG